MRMSSLAQLLSFFGRVPGDELWLTVGESPYILHSGKRSALGSHPLSAAVVFAAASELVPIDELRCLPTGRARVVRHQHDGDSWVVEIRRSNGGVSLCIRRSRASEARAGALGDTLTPDRANDLSFDDDQTVYPPSPWGGIDDTEVFQSGGAGEGGGGPAGSLRAALAKAASAGASDLHLFSSCSAFVRVDGVLRPGRAVGIPVVEDLVADLRRIGLFGGGAFGAARRSVVYEVEGVARFRFEVFSNAGGIGAAIRILPIVVPTLECLGLPKVCADLCQLPAGLVLVSGPAGSGKSSTLAAMVGHVSRHRSDHVATIEDPVEFVHSSTRSLVRHHAVAASFVDTMLLCARLDANVVMVGALADAQSVALALQMAEAGRLVIAGIDTLTAVSAIERVVEAFPSDKQGYARLVVGRALKGVVSHALCRRVGGGRVGAHEVLVSTPAVAALIRDGKSFQVSGIMQASKALGMSTLNESLTALVQRQLVTPKEAMSRAVDKPGLAAMLKQGSRFSNSHRLQALSTDGDVPRVAARIR